jgi:CRP/FNR family transcriptional regulator, cyclic AMP receptor protein
MLDQDEKRPRRRRRVLRPSIVMKTPYGLQVIESCLTCPILKDHLFCDLSSQTLRDLDAISSSATYPKGAILFVEGQSARGAFVICSGRVKLSTGSSHGKSVILRIAEAGEVVGLPGTISGKPYEATAEALEPIQANFLPRDRFLQFLHAHGDASLKVSEMLCHIYYATYQEVKYLGLSESAAEKLARFILNLAPQTHRDGVVRVQLTLTHEEIAEVIGSSRETVTRLFAGFKKEKFLEVHGSTLVIANLSGLQNLVEEGVGSAKNAS